MDEPSVAVNWAVHPVLERQSSPASLSCSPWLTSGRKEDEEMVENKKMGTGEIKYFNKNQEIHFCFEFLTGSHSFTRFWYYLCVRGLIRNLNAAVL